MSISILIGSSVAAPYPKTFEAFNLRLWDPNLLGRCSGLIALLEYTGLSSQTHLFFSCGGGKIA